MDPVTIITALYKMVSIALVREFDFFYVLWPKCEEKNSLNVATREYHQSGRHQISCLHLVFEQWVFEKWVMQLAKVLHLPLLLNKLPRQRLTFVDTGILMPSNFFLENIVIICFVLFSCQFQHFRCFFACRHLGVRFNCRNLECKHCSRQYIL